jgi:Flp pilus assembly pilin Flp
MCSDRKAKCRNGRIASLAGVAGSLRLQDPSPAFPASFLHFLHPSCISCNFSALFLRLLRDETAVTSTEYVVAALAIALGAVVASRVIAGALIDYLHRIYVVVTLPIP